MKVTANAPEIPKVNLRKAEMQMMIKDYAGRHHHLDRAWWPGPGKAGSAPHRAISELQTGQPSRRRQK